MARKTKQEAQETRSGIIDAAERLFHAKGVASTSLQQIAEEAQVTRGAIYWHFKDKAELFEAMMDRATMPLEEGMQPIEATEPEPVLSLAELRFGLVNVFHSAQHNERTRRVFEIAMTKVEYTGEMQGLHLRKLDAHRDWRAQNRAAFDLAVTEGVLPKGTNAEMAAIALVALVDGLLHQWILEPGAFDLVAVGQASVEGFLTSLSQKATPLLPPLTADEKARLGQQGFCRRSAAQQLPSN
ncbi:TetR family transcriptional regulator [Pelomonas sp. SE-A7]|uniref:TetR family transcriptional regulator n=1 Tax=Pelomonas sp. SE-A7 TaxID=3054953 RepID=UPI00259C7996|nr:TetR family transcriptional regulator [Pelomonas sp. SE-A7]MDM4767776.1 TetR family transcriptional regulator [Pelomonas sp. SE-A7]